MNAVTAAASAACAAGARGAERLDGQERADTAATCAAIMARCRGPGRAAADGRSHPRRPPAPNISGGSQTSRVSSSVPNAPSCATRLAPAACATVQAGAGQPAGLADLGADDHADAGGARRGHDVERPQHAAHLRHAQVDDPAASVARQRARRPAAVVTLSSTMIGNRQPIGEARQVVDAPGRRERLLDGEERRVERPQDRRRASSTPAHRLLASARTRTGPSSPASAASFGAVARGVARQLHLEVAQPHGVVAMRECRERLWAPCRRAPPSTGTRRRAAAGRAATRAAAAPAGRRDRAGPAPPRTRRPARRRCRRRESASTPAGRRASRSPAGRDAATRRRPARIRRFRPVTYGRGHPSPTPIAPSDAAAVTTTEAVSPRSADACLKRVVNGMTSGVISRARRADGEGIGAIGRRWRRACRV